MAFYEVRFPEKISLHATGGPSFLTNIVQVNSGAEFRDQVWSAGRAKYEVAHAARTEAKYKELLAFFRSMRGRLHGFRFKDWSDYRVLTGEGVFVMLTSTTFQLYKRYTFGSQTYDRKITKPVSGKVTVTGGTTPTVNTVTGVVTVASGTPTSWVGEFDVPVRFDVDDLDGQIVDKHRDGTFIMAWESIPLVETRT